MDTVSKRKNPTEYLLCSMYKNVKIESENIVSLLPKVEDRFLAGEMTASLQGYMILSRSVEDMMLERGMEPFPPGVLSKIGARAGAFINTVMSAGTSKIARLCRGESRQSAQRLEHICEALSTKCDARVVGVCREIIEKERQNCERMEAFI